MVWVPTVNSFTLIQFSAPVSGSSVDWVFEKLGVKLCFALELRDDGFYGFLLPPEFIKPTAEEAWAGIKVIVK